jgi:hypothetical protein
VFTLMLCIGALLTYARIPVLRHRIISLAIPALKTLSASMDGSVTIDLTFDLEHVNRGPWDYRFCSFEEKPRGYETGSATQAPPCLFPRNIACKVCPFRHPSRTPPFRNLPPNLVLLALRSRGDLIAPLHQDSL